MPVEYQKKIRYPDANVQRERQIRNGEALWIREKIEIKLFQGEGISMRIYFDAHFWCTRMQIDYYPRRHTC